MSGQSRSNPYASLSSNDSGMLQPGTSAVLFPNKPCKLAKFKAASTNVGVISVGKTGLVAGTGANGGFQLSAREETGWIPINNINLVGVIGQNATDWVSWWTLS